LAKRKEHQEFTGKLADAGISLRAEPPLQVSSSRYRIPNKIGKTKVTDPAKLRPGETHIDCLEWDYDPRLPIPDGPPASGCLAAFLRLRDAQNVVGYAQKYGILGICVHSSPSHGPASGSFTHYLRCPWCRAPADFSPDVDQVEGMYLAQFHRCRLSGDLDNARLALTVQNAFRKTRSKEPLAESDIPRPREPIETWLVLATRFRAILLIAASIWKGHVPRTEDWEAVMGHQWGRTWTQNFRDDDMIEVALFREAPPPTRNKDKVEHARRLVVMFVNAWMVDEGQTHVKLEWDPKHERLQLVLQGEGLLGALVTELVAAISSPQGVYQCQYPPCGQPYAEGLNDGERLPRRNRTRLHYCGECQRTRMKEINAWRGRMRWADQHKEPQRRRKSTERVSN